ncbi:MAG: hypothetical protein AAF658_12185, partial [Myxococcota bacterium]
MAVSPALTTEAENLDRHDSAEGLDREWTKGNLWLGLPFYAIHLLPLLAFFTGTRWVDWAVCFALYFVRMFAVTGVSHRYFSHRTYTTSRWFQFALAFLAQTTAQKGV